MRLRYTLEGAAELDAVLTYIEERSSHGARNVQRRIQAMTELLLQYPLIGKPTRNGRLRRVLASPYPYLLFYQVTEEDVIIHGVRHTARNPLITPGH